jgi:hypothetical protein
MRIELRDEVDVHTIWFALEKYSEVLLKDRESKYNGDPRYGDEDEEFLTGEIEQCGNVLNQLREQGFAPFKGE